MVEKVKFDGEVYKRYPNADGAASKYFRRQEYDGEKMIIRMLHREYWKKHNGEIPEGKIIHHKDGNPANNHIDNLECVTPKEHVERHPKMAGLSEADPEGHLEKLQDGIREFFRTDEGSEVQRKKAKKLWEGLYENPKVSACDQCGKEFEHYTNSRFCSNACKAKHRRESGVDDEERECVICGSVFKVNKYEDTETCSRGCTGALISWTNRVDNND